MNGIQIKGIEVYYPDCVKNTDEIINEFSQKGKDISVFVKEFLGKEQLHLVKDNKENSLSMGIKVAQKVLEKTGLKGEDMDMIIFSSMAPEYFSPPCALIIHNAIGGNNHAVCYDINVNCIGMSFCLHQISKQMEADLSINRVLIIGSDYTSYYTSKNDEIMYPNVGDIACGMIIERTNRECGILGAKFYVASQHVNKVAYPICGNSHMREAVEEDKYGIFGLTGPDLNESTKLINNILEEHHLSINDISMFCLSQFSAYNIEYLRAVLDIPEEKSLYVSSEIGYSGTASPFVTLYEAIKQGKVKRGDYVLIWTIGAAIQDIVVLLKY